MHTFYLKRIFQQRNSNFRANDFIHEFDLKTRKYFFNKYVICQSNVKINANVKVTHKISIMLFSLSNLYTCFLIKQKFFFASVYFSSVLVIITHLLFLLVTKIIRVSKIVCDLCIVFIISYA